MPTLTSAWVLALMMLAAPRSPYRATFDKTSEAIAEYAAATPLFAGARGAERTAALLVAVGQFESEFQPNAEGDCDAKKTTKFGTCEKGARGRSLCMLQVGESNLASFGVTREEIQNDVRVCVRVGLQIMKDSFRVCREAPLEERLTWYAGGGAGCATNEDARKKSRHRMLRAAWLFGRAERGATAMVE